MSRMGKRIMVTAALLAILPAALVYGVSDQEIARMREAMPEELFAEPAEPRTLLVFNLSEGFKHSSIPYWAKALDVMAEKTGAFTVEHSEDMAIFSPDTLERFDAICLNNTTNLEFNSEQRQALMQFVRGGKGIVGIHAATDNFYDWPEARYMMGGVFQGHPWTAGGTWSVKLDDPEHPMMAMFHGEGFSVNDEIYRTNPPYYSRDRLRVLMSLDMSDPANRNAPGVVPDDDDTGISWIRPYGAGRVFYFSLGHNHHITWTPKFVAQVLAGIQYAMGDFEVDDTPLGPPVAELDADVVQSLVDKVSDYDWDKSRADAVRLEAAIRKHTRSAENLKRIEQLMLPLLSEQSSLAVKDFTVRQLSVMGTAASVPALAALLDDSQTEHLGRFALERIGAEQAEAALLEKLAQQPDKATTIGLLSSLAVRRSHEAVDLIARAAGDSDLMIARAGLRALAAIGTPQAAAALRDVYATLGADLQADVLDAMAVCADNLAREGNAAEAIVLYERLYEDDKPSLSRIAALRGLAGVAPARSGALLPAAIAEADPVFQAGTIQLVAEIEDAATIEAVVSVMPQLSRTARISLLTALADNGSRAGLPAALRAMDSADEGIRAAAYRAIAVLGDASSVLPLAMAAGRATDRTEADAAREALYRLGGDGINDAIVDGIERMTGPQRDEAAAVELIRAVRQRRIDTANDLLFAGARDEDRRIGQESLRSLQVTAGPQDMEAMAELLAEQPSSAMENLVVSTAEKRADQDQRAAELLDRFETLETTTAKASFLRVLGQLGDVHAVPVIRRMRDSDVDAIQNAAFRAMADWPGVDFREELRQLATESDDATQRVLAFRAYVRMLGTGEGKSDAETVDALAEAMQLTDRPQDHRLVLSALGGFATPRSLSLALEALEDAALRSEAEVAVVAIADRLAHKAPTNALAAAETVRDQTGNDALKQQAADVIEKAGQWLGFITTWQIAGPYTEEGKDDEDLFDIAFAPEEDVAQADWSPMPVSDDASNFWLLDLDKAIGGHNRVAYARTVLVSPNERDAVFEIGSDDGIKVWLNGQLMHAHKTRRPVQPAQDTVSVQLAEGDNEVLMKITQAAGDWGYCLRVVCPDGAPMIDLNVK